MYHFSSVTPLCLSSLRFLFSLVFRSWDRLTLFRCCQQTKALLSCYYACGPHLWMYRVLGMLTGNKFACTKIIGLLWSYFACRRILQVSRDVESLTTWAVLIDGDTCDTGAEVRLASGWSSTTLENQPCWLPIIIVYSVKRFDFGQISEMPDYHQEKKKFLT